ncbi:MAG: delta-class carbonic anhydrase [Gallionella sp.]|jgi:hypothetical protein|nr:delta-class carbonic anhydrase [Gallionella sp.]
MLMKQIVVALAAATLSSVAFASEHGHDSHGATAEHGHAAAVADNVITEQRAALAANTKGKGFGPQAPRDIDSKVGSNDVVFSQAPDYSAMNLCNIHFHESAEHKGGEFTTYAGNGNGEGSGSGYKYNGHLSHAEMAATDDVCNSEHGALSVGDTIEVHYVHSTADVTPGPTLGSCVAAGVDVNPQLRVMAQVYVLVNDKNALDFGKLATVNNASGKYQANVLANLGTPVSYIGSTTGPKYNEKGSEYQVSWSVYPKVAKVNIATVGAWCKGNQFKEDHAHGVRNLVKNPDLLSEIK